MDILSFLSFLHDSAKKNGLASEHARLPRAYTRTSRAEPCTQKTAGNYFCRHNDNDRKSSDKNFLILLKTLAAQGLNQLLDILSFLSFFAKRTEEKLNPTVLTRRMAGRWFLVYGDSKRSRTQKKQKSTTLFRFL